MTDQQLSELSLYFTVLARPAVQSDEDRIDHPGKGRVVKFLRRQHIAAGSVTGSNGTAQLHDLFHHRMHHVVFGFLPDVVGIVFQHQVDRKLVEEMLFRTARQEYWDGFVFVGRG